MVWLVCQGGFSGTALATVAAARFPDAPIGTAIAALVSVGLGVGFFDKASRALGEEIGWRGFLVPELAKVTNFAGVTAVSGLMWAVWHFPLIFYAGCRSKAPPWYSLSCFVAMIMAWAAVAAWLRMKSDSVWPPVILHASHNALIQLVLNPLTLDTGKAIFWTDEFGAGVALGLMCVAAFIWRRGDSIRAARSA